MPFFSSSRESDVCFLKKTTPVSGKVLFVLFLYILFVSLKLTAAPETLLISHPGQGCLEGTIFTHSHFEAHLADNQRETSVAQASAMPWWKQHWPGLFVFLLVLGMIAVLRKFELNRLKLKNRTRIAEFETKKLRELDQMKSKFFANISHELRTPLTLIMGPLEQMLEENQDPKKLQNLSLMNANVVKLLNLVNQLLDLSRLESGNYQVRVSLGDLVGFLKGIVMSFASMAEQKNIKLNLNLDTEIEKESFNRQFYFDRDILEKILNNLLSNAFKFTPDGGEVNLKACVKPSPGPGNFLEISLQDTGIGIPQENLPHIFDRFYQVDSSHIKGYEGSGIGLAFVKELTRVHQGKIMAKSEPGKGTIFVLRLPIGKDHFSEQQIGRDSLQEIKSQDQNPMHHLSPLKPAKKVPFKGQESNHTIILLVEDHKEVRHYIRQDLQEHFRVEDASNALEGQKLALDLIPDLIICDIMMPGMDGLEFCKAIKNDIKTSHIPIILLTALSEEEFRIQGLELGADDYLTKPFNPRELLARAMNLIESRQMLREKFSNHSIIKPGEISVTPRDRSFMEHLIRIVEENIANEKYSIEDLSRDIGMSQSQLHRKLKALVNQTTSHFVRSIKMHRAKELLEKDAGTIAEIAYMVGYDDPGYFSKSYKAFFGQLPSKTRKKN